MKRFFILIAIASILTACGESTNSTDTNATGNHKVTVKEILQASEYSYLKVEEGGSENWIAVSKADFKEGETYYYLEGMLMENFESKDLKRTFEKIYFVDKISDKPFETASSTTDANANPHSKGTAEQEDNINIPVVEGGITIGQLFTEKDKYKEQSVKVRGKVLKFSKEIMGKNWAHIQDGTKSDKDFDLTVTTMDDMQVGDTVTFEGKISIDKDFGSGYFYNVIMEDAKKL